MLPLIINKATPQDILHVALTIAEALGDNIMERYVDNGNSIPEQDRKFMDLLYHVVQREDTLYSYTRCTLARTKDGQVAGGLVAYPGDDYLQRRNTTFSLLDTLIHFDIEQMDAEVQPDEYYLDSLAVWPQFRGHGIARQLMLQGISQGRQMQRTTTLACAPDNHGAHKLYTSLGFRDSGRLFIFGEDYIRMEIV